MSESMGGVQGVHRPSPSLDRRVSALRGTAFAGSGSAGPRHRAFARVLAAGMFGSARSTAANRVHCPVDLRRRSDMTFRKRIGGAAALGVTMVIGSGLSAPPRRRPPIS